MRIQINNGNIVGGECDCTLCSVTYIKQEESADLYLDNGIMMGEICPSCIQDFHTGNLLNVVLNLLLKERDEEFERRSKVKQALLSL